MVLNIYFYFEFFTLLTLLIRIFLYSRKYKIQFQEHAVLFIYLLLIFLNNISCFFFENQFFHNQTLIFKVYNALVPSILVFVFFLSYFKLSVIKMLMALCASIFCVFLNNDFLNSNFYLIAILLMLFKSVKLVLNSSSDAHKVPLYIMFSIDLFFSLFSMQLGIQHFNWHESQLLSYLSVISLTAFASMLIMSHIYIKRFFSPA